jgi:hypothetical protein
MVDSGNTLHFFVVPEGTTLARFSLFDSEIGEQNDLDLQIQEPGPSFSFVCSNGRGPSEEQCDLVNPVPGVYAAFVIDFASDPGSTSYRLWNFILNGINVANSTISASASAMLGTTGNITINWADLSAAGRALGVVSYDDGVNPLNAQTEIMIVYP